MSKEQSQDSEEKSRDSFIDDSDEEDLEDVKERVYSSDLKYKRNRHEVLPIPLKRLKKGNKYVGLIGEATESNLKEDLKEERETQKFKKFYDELSDEESDSEKKEHLLEENDFLYCIMYVKIGYAEEPKYFNIYSKVRYSYNQIKELIFKETLKSNFNIIKINFYSQYIK